MAEDKVVEEVVEEQAAEKVVEETPKPKKKAKAKAKDAIPEEPVGQVAPVGAKTESMKTMAEVQGTRMKTMADRNRL